MLNVHTTQLQFSIFIYILMQLQRKTFSWILLNCLFIVLIDGEEGELFSQVSSSNISGLIQNLIQNI